MLVQMCNFVFGNATGRGEGIYATPTSGNDSMAANRSYVCLKHFDKNACNLLPATGSLQLAPCNWLPATGSLQLAPCNWLPATGSLQLAPCNWLPCNWLPATGSLQLATLQLAPCNWLPATGYPATGSLQLAPCNWLSRKQKCCFQVQNALNTPFAAME